MTGPGDGVRLAALVAALSLATDLGLGQPQQHIIRQTLIALRMAELDGLSDDERAAIFYVSLLAWVGCIADGHEMAKWFGNDMAVRADSYLVDMTGMPMMRFMVGHVASGSSPIRRLTMIGRFLAGGSKEVEQSMAAHCQTSGDLSLRLGLGPEVRDPLQQAFERWDGKGSPAKLAGPQIARIMRIVHVANDVEALHRIGGVDAAAEMLRARRGTEFDPELVDLFCANAEDLLTAIDDVDGWDALIGGHGPQEDELSGDELDRALEAFADYTDVRSPFTLGHSRGVARLAAAAATTVGLPADDVVLVRRAGLIHDVGTVGVSAGILDQPGRLSDAERERVRTHPYLTARTFSKPPALAAIGQLAAMHHERMDGSGYPSGLTADSLPMTARVIAAADVYHALLEPRPHRPRPGPGLGPRRSQFRGHRGPAGRRRGTSRAGRRRAPGAAPRRPRRRTDPPRSRDPRAGVPGADEAPDRRRAGHLGQDGERPRRAHLRQARSEHPGRGSPLRPAPRVDHGGRSRLKSLVF